MWEQKELECLALAVMSPTNLLRIGEAWTVSCPRDGKPCFMGEKSRSGDHDQDLGPLLSRWMRFIKEQRHKRGVAEDRPHGYQLPGDLEEAWVALVAGSKLEHYKWHRLWRGGATQLWALSARNQIVMLARGWESPSVGRHYPKHARKFVERGEQLVPVCGDNGYRLVYGDWSSKQWWPAWLRKEVKELTAEARTYGNVVGPTGQAARKRRRTWLAGPLGRSRRQRAHSCRTGKIAEMGEELDMGLVRVPDEVCDQVQEKERTRMLEARASRYWEFAMQQVMLPQRPTQRLWAACPS